MNNDFQNGQERSRAGAVNAAPLAQPRRNTVVNTQDDAIVAQLAEILQPPVGEGPSYIPEFLMENYTQQHPPSLPLTLPEQSVLGSNSQSFVPPFHTGPHWSPPHHGLYSNLPPAGGYDIPSISLSLASQYGVSSPGQSSHETSTLSSPISPTVPVGGLALDDDNAATDEKRRRNTAASARFRIKKKQRTTNLERSVSDLTGRADELEREAADLRRENAWLKEIVMLRGTRLATFNFTQQLQALGQNLDDDVLTSRTSRPDQASSAGSGRGYAHGRGELEGPNNNSE